MERVQRSRPRARIRQTSTSPATAPSTDPVTRYALDVVAKKIIAGKGVRLACQRHLDDLKHGHRRGLKWDIAAAMRAIEFFPDILRLPEEGTPFILTAWEQFIVGSLFGWKKADGYRRFQIAFIEIGKGNGKTPLVAGILLYLMVADGERGAQCYTAATSREQADLCFQDAVKMVDASPALSARVQKSGIKKVFNLAHLASGSFLRPISSERKGLDGKRVQGAALDEVHEHPSAVAVDKIRAGTKGRRQPMIIEITNSGFDRTSVCWNHHEYSLKIVEGTLKDDGWFAYVCQLDTKDKWTDPKVWIKANPNLGVSIKPEYLEALVREATGMPSKQNIVKRLNFCVWTKSGEVFIPTEMWDKCRGKYTEKELEGRDAVGGLDLSKARDFAAFVALFPGKPVRFLPYFWLPEDSAAALGEKSSLPVSDWVERGLLELTPGNVIDFDFIRKRINELANKFRFTEIGYDEHQAQQIAVQLEGDGHTMVPVRQGFLTLNEPTCEVLRLVKSKGLEHPDNPIMNWMISNIAVKYDAAGNIKIDKEKSSEKVDGPAALVDAMARKITQPEGQQHSTEVMVV
jgi:phage terminase large subunit-like protein